jgi:hypothetical protein
VLCQANETIDAVKDLKMKVAKVKSGERELVGGVEWLTINWG